MKVYISCDIEGISGLNKKELLQLQLLLLATIAPAVDSMY